MLDLSWVHAELALYYAPLGRPSIDPVLMIRMLLVGDVFAIRSSCPSGSGRRNWARLRSRPAHVGVTLGGRGDIELPVRLVEPLGRDTLLYFDAGTERAFVAVREGIDMAEVKVGARMALSLDPRRLYLFGADGSRVAPA